MIDAETQEALLARAGGNPLYAEQYTRVLLERGDVLELPETVQGIIAARLDALSEPEKRLLQNAAVVGKVFWLGAVDAVAGVRGEARRRSSTGSSARSSCSAPVARRSPTSTSTPSATS